MNPAQVFALAQDHKPARVKRGRKSVLTPHVEAIRYMRSQKHMNYRQIHAFFSEQAGIKCTYQNLLHFARKAKIGR